MITKYYTWDSLLDDRESVMARMNRIERFSKICKSVPVIEYDIDKNGIIYKQAKVKDRKKSTLIDKDHALESLTMLANDLQLMSDNYIVHGDINSKNIVLSNNKFYLVDFEPSLRQIKNGRSIWMITQPYISLSDIESGIITSKTDKIGFYYFVRKIMGKLNAEKFAQLVEYRIQKRINSLPIEECQLEDFSFRNVLELALNK